jgi:hypothetical protein
MRHRMLSTDAPLPLATHDASAAVHGQCAPQAPCGALQCRTASNGCDEPLTILSILLPVF